MGFFDKKSGKKKRTRGAFLNQFDIANVSSGTMVTMHDDGVRGDGEPNQARAHLKRKLQQRDADGDPCFAFVCSDESGVPDPVRKSDYNDGQGAVDLLSDLGAKLHFTPSRHPDCATLADKFEMNRQNRSEAEAEIAAKRGAQLPSEFKERAKQFLEASEARHADGAVALRAGNTGKKAPAKKAKS